MDDLCWRRWWGRSGEFSNDRRNVGLWRKLGDELLDLTLGLVRRPGQYALAVLVREMGREGRDAAQVQPAIPEHREEHRVLPSGASDGDTEVRLGLRKVQDLDAVREHGRASVPGVQAAMVDLPDVRNEVGLDPSRLLSELEKAVEELVVRKRLKCVCVLHGSCIPRTFFRAWARFRAMKNERDDCEGSL